MCLNPHLLLGKKIIYKGYEKTLLYWNTSFEDYKRGFINISKLDHIPYKLSCDLIKYGLMRCSSNGSYTVYDDIIFDVRFEIPCKKCLECTRSRAREWALRCHFESLLHKDNYFVTLTYNDENIPLNYYSLLDTSTGEYHRTCVKTLSKPHTISFMKLLRQKFKREKNHDGIRFFMCGEYGTKSNRPHYHYILFNLPLDDLILIGKSKTGHDLYRSPFIESVWKRGFVTVQKYSIETARYTAQYCCKKLDKKGSFIQGREMEFINMSRNKGIGMDYLLKNCNSIYNLKDLNVIDSFYFTTLKNGDYKREKYSMPQSFTRYFKPVTDSKRSLDTEHGSLRCLLNDNNEFIYDVLQYKKFECQLYCENYLKSKMNAYGFNYDTDRYSEKYLEYLSIIRNEEETKFKIIRNSC